MKKNIWTWIGVICLVVGAGFAFFTDIANDIPAIVVAAFGLGTLVVNAWKKSEKKDWKVVVTIILAIIGAFAMAIAGQTEDMTVKIWTAVAAVVSIVVGLLFPKVMSLFTKK